MNRKLVFSNALKEKLDFVSSDTKSVWADYGITDTNSLMSKIIKILNDEYVKLNISKFEFREDVSMYGEASTYFGILETEAGVPEAYVFMIPPKYETRSGVLAQQVFPVLSGLMPHYRNSCDYKISNRPIYIINANEANQTAAMAVNIMSGQLLDFHYIDIFGRDIKKTLNDKGFQTVVQSVYQYNKILTETNKEKENDFFELDESNKVIKYLTVRLKDGIHVHNEPYWFVLKAYTIFYLGMRENYKFDMLVFNSLQRGNKTLDSFRDYICRFE